MNIFAIPRDTLILPYDKAGVQIVEICLSTRSHNGGLINLQELCTLLRQRRKADPEPVSEDDCLRAISKLKVLTELLIYS